LRGRAYIRGKPKRLNETPRIIEQDEVGVTRIVAAGGWQLLIAQPFDMRWLQADLKVGLYVRTARVRPT
jgi:hypothetical protein